MIVCAECGRENAADARFCSGCGTSLETAPAAPREERKVVSVLFADLVGFTARSEQLDPEDVRATLSPYYARLRAELERHGGTVEKFIGDAVMALFGAPVAHDDDPERAVRAALAIRDWVLEEDDLQVRIAVNTGEALVSLGARPAEGEGMAAGDVVNAAARLQSAAPVNGVLVGERTYRATNDAIDYREAEPVHAKGKAEPLRVWEAVQAHARFGVDVPHEARTALVGRERELEVLRGALDRARSERSPQLLTLVGVPGVGKSRLLYELSRSVDADPELIAWRQGRSLPYGEGVSFWALAEVVKAQAGVLESDDADAAERKLTETVAGLGVGEDDADWLHRHLAALVGLGGEDAAAGGDRRSESFAAWRRFFEALADQRPLVLVLEDLHWADDGLLDFVDHLVDWASGVPLLVVATARPELLERRPSWGGGKSNATTLSLQALAEDDAARLLGSLLGRSVLEAGEQARVLERVGGNPLYAEQYAQLLAEGGAGGELPLPESIQGIVGARLDGLPLEEKQLLQDAAVIGKVFWPGAVAALAGADAPAALDERLHALERKHFVRRDRRSSVADETQYAFLHLLLRDVAYAQIPRSARLEKHARAARWLEGLGRPDDHAEMLAHHYLCALEVGRAAGQDTTELARPAQAALSAAGDRARSLSAYGAAARFYREALGLCPDDARAEQADLLYRLALAMFDGDEEERDSALAAAREALLAVGDTPRAAETDALRAQFEWMKGETDACSSYLARAHELVRDAPPSPAKARVLSQVARFRFLAGEVALDDAREALALAASFDLDEIRAHALITIGTARCRQGDLDGRADIQRGLELALAENRLPVAIRAYSSIGAVADLEGDLREANRATTEAWRLAERLGGTASIRWVRGNMIFSMLELGDWDECMAAADAFLAEAETAPHYHDCYVLATRAFIRLARDDLAGALDDQARSLARAREIRDRQVVVPAVGFSAFVLAEAGRTEEAEALLDEFVAEPDVIGYALEDALWAADLLDRRDELAALIDEDDVRLRARAARAFLVGEFAAAGDLFDEMGTGRGAALARLRAAEVLLASGRRAEADDQLQRALAFFRAVRASRYVKRGEALLAVSA
ncbi:MAG TPA: AAA family ATPase [Gaiellaceae bacterium]|nr:AAA family ATPase [Gaiellaceae bacterium]